MGDLLEFLFIKGLVIIGVAIGTFIPAYLGLLLGFYLETVSLAEASIWIKPLFALGYISTICLLVLAAIIAIKGLIILFDV